MTVLLCGSSQTHLGTQMPSVGGYIIRADDPHKGQCDSGLGRNTVTDTLPNKSPSVRSTLLLEAYQCILRSLAMVIFTRIVVLAVRSPK